MNKFLDDFLVFLNIFYIISLQHLNFSPGTFTIKVLAERGFDPRTSGLWAQHASAAPLCSACLLFYRNLPSLDTNIMNDKMDCQRTGTLRQNAKLSPTLHLHYGQSDVTVDDCRNSRLSDRLPGICRGRTPCESKVCKDKLVAVVGFEPTPPERLEP